jgi:hypothetical protein
MIQADDYILGFLTLSTFYDYIINKYTIKLNEERMPFIGYLQKQIGLKEYSIHGDKVQINDDSLNLFIQMHLAQGRPNKFGITDYTFNDFRSFFCGIMDGGASISVRKKGLVARININTYNENLAKHVVSELSNAIGTGTYTAPVHKAKRKHRVYWAGADTVAIYNYIYQDDRDFIIPEYKEKLHEIAIIRYGSQFNCVCQSCGHKFINNLSRHNTKKNEHICWSCRQGGHSQIEQPNHDVFKTLEKDLSNILLKSQH